jgi:hypothetical protein
MAGKNQYYWLDEIGFINTQTRERLLTLKRY